MRPIRPAPPAGPGRGLELVADPSAAPPSPTEEDLLVLYLDEAVPELHARLLAAGGRRVTARNPYW